MVELKPLRQGFLRTRGRRVYWELFGEEGVEGREVVCLLNGLAMSTASWHSFLPRLLDSYDVLLYDYLGQGRSSSRDEPVTIPELGDDLARICRRERISGLHLLGISYGGFVALDFARRHQELLRTLTLSGILLSREELFLMYEDLSLRFYRGGPEAFELYTHYLYEKIFGEAFVRRARPHLESMRRSFHDRYRDRVHSLVRLTEAQGPFFADLEANLPGYRAVRVPTLILAGAEDRVIAPAVQEKIRRTLPDALFEVVEGSGHVVYLEAPEVFWGRVRRFWSEEACAP